MTQVVDEQFQSHMGQLNELLEQAQSLADPAARDLSAQIVQTLMEFHGAGIRKIAEHLGEAPLGERLLHELAQDDVVSSLLLLYEVHPLDLEARVKLALEKVRPALAGHGGNVQLLDITSDGAVHLKLEGSCHGCSSSTQTLKNLIEQAIYDRAPDVTAIRVEGVEEPPPKNGDGFVPVEQLLASIGKHS